MFHHLQSSPTKISNIKLYLTNLAILRTLTGNPVGTLPLAHDLSGEYGKLYFFGGNDRK